MGERWERWGGEVDRWREVEEKEREMDAGGRRDGGTGGRRDGGKEGRGGGTEERRDEGMAGRASGWADGWCLYSAK